MHPVFQVFVFVFGTIVGSFLNAVIWRLRTRESFVSGRSYCPHCRHTLSPIDLVPIVSFLFLRGRCRYCAAGISPQYIVVEAVMGLVFLLFGLQAFNGAEALTAEGLSGLLMDWYLVSVLMIVFVFDLRYTLILRSVTLPAVALALIGNIALGGSPLAYAGGAAAAAGFFWLQRVASGGRWVGGGDVHLGLLMGAVLGFPLVAVALFIAYIVGSVAGVALMVRRKASWKTEVPFGTFLSAATVVTMLWGDHILSWYLSLL